MSQKTQLNSVSIKLFPSNSFSCVFNYSTEKCVIRGVIHFRFASEYCAHKKNPQSVSRVFAKYGTPEGSDWYQIDPKRDWIGTAFGLCCLRTLKSAVPNL